MLGVVACVLAVVCKRMQQLPTMLGPAVHRGKDTKPCVMRVRGPNNVGRPMQTHPTLLGRRTLITHGLQRPMGCILPTMHHRLGVVASVCTQPKKVNDSNCPVQKVFLYRPIQNSFRKLLNSPQSITSTHVLSDFPICIILMFFYALTRHAN